MAEATIEKTSTILVVLPSAEQTGGTDEVDRMASDFSGTVVSDLSTLPDFVGKTVYLCGNIAKAADFDLKMAKRVFIIRELSQGYDDYGNWPTVGVGQVPILVHGVGVYYRRLFGDGIDLFNQVSTEHSFQHLTESTKPGKAHRTGVYLTSVEQDSSGELHYRLLRCSSNFSGPTLNFREGDTRIVESLNREAASVFRHQAPLNHVLAQIYHNTPATGAQKQRKAVIKAHSDKTKDMPENGAIVAFCTFYDNLDRLKRLASTGDPFDYGHKGVSGLTKLRFRLKKSVAERPGCTLASQFTVTLYPNSAFFIPLSTNRLYTHEIRPSALDAVMLPTRMGYVVRCSDTDAVHSQGKTYLKLDDSSKRVELEPPTTEGMSELRKLYAEENTTDSVVDYGNKFLFSMNRGDYSKPITYAMADRFRVFNVPTEDSIFEELLASVKFEDVGKGRQGTVLVKTSETRGTPIVRTTAKYSAPAQCFKPAHERLAKQIQEETASLQYEFNNALVEQYTNAYSKMGFHSDQALDLKEGSSIALFSCYRQPDRAVPPRKLVVESKDPNGGTFEIPLNHSSVVVFSLETNRKFRHKIVLDTGANPPENQWLGVTFRTSKTFVNYFHGGEGAAAPHFEDGTLLTVANDGESKEFYKLRRRENEETDFVHPRLACTVSKSDLMPPTEAGATG